MQNRTVKNSMALRVVKNEKLLCSNCLKSGPADVGEDQAVYCYLNDEAKVKHRDHYCAEGLWLVDGNVMEFKEAFQKIYDRVKDTTGKENPKEIKLP